MTDQHTTYGTKIVVGNTRKAHCVLDEILANANANAITEQDTDTHGGTLVTNVVVTHYQGLAVESVRRSGRRIDDEVLAHIWPVHSEKIDFFGSIDVGIEDELAQLGPPAPVRRRCRLLTVA